MKLCFIWYIGYVVDYILKMGDSTSPQLTPATLKIVVDVNSI